MSNPPRRPILRIQDCTTFEEIETHFPLFIEEARRLQQSGPDDRTAEDLAEYSEEIATLLHILDSAATE